MIWVLLSGLLFLGFSLWLFLLPPYDLEKIIEANDRKVIREEVEHRWTYQMRAVLAGILCTTLGVGLFLSEATHGFSMAILSLFLAVVSATMAVLVCFSRKFSNLIWKHLWHYDRKLESYYLSGILAIFSLINLFFSYIYLDHTPIGRFLGF